MALVKDLFAKKLRVFIKSLNVVEQKDKDAVINKFCNELENDVYSAIRSITIEIPPGAIQVATASGSGTNAGPIILNGVVK